MATRGEHGTRRGDVGRSFVVTARERRVLDQYLERYAEPEAAYAGELTDRYRAAIVAPLCGESPEALEAWERAVLAGERAATEPVLWIAVVNGREGSADDVLRVNQELLESWRRSSRVVRRLSLSGGSSTRVRAPAAAELLVRGDGAHHVLLIDASSAGHRFPRKQGVGLARRIGCDVAVALARRGLLLARYVGAADGDARLPPGYVRALERAPGVTALLFPFEHVSDGDARVLAATRLVECSWRYYVLGLAWAGSPFAFQTVGSCIAPEIVAYAQARGFPRREAGEDFHLLAKLAKLGEVECLAEPVVGLTARISSRVPFGTGPAVQRALSQPGAALPDTAPPDAAPPDTASPGAADRNPMAGGGGGHQSGDASPWEHVRWHDPRVFVALRRLLESLVALADDAASALTPPSDDPELPDAVVVALQERILSWSQRLAPRLAACPTAGHRRRRVFEAFDALATLQAIHALRDAGLPPIPWRDALRDAPFLEAPLDGSVTQVLESMRASESRLRARRGLAPPRTSSSDLDDCRLP